MAKTPPHYHPVQTCKSCPAACVVAVGHSFCVDQGPESPDFFQAAGIEIEDKSAESPEHASCVEYCETSPPLRMDKDTCVAIICDGQW